MTATAGDSEGGKVLPHHRSSAVHLLRGAGPGCRIPGCLNARIRRGVRRASCRRSCLSGDRLQAAGQPRGHSPPRGGRQGGGGGGGRSRGGGCRGHRRPRPRHRQAAGCCRRRSGSGDNCVCVSGGDSGGVVVVAVVVAVFCRSSSGSGNWQRSRNIRRIDRKARRTNVDPQPPPPHRQQQRGAALVALVAKRLCLRQIQVIACDQRRQPLRKRKKRSGKSGCSSRWRSSSEFEAEERGAKAYRRK